MRSFIWRTILAVLTATVLAACNAPSGGGLPTIDPTAALETALAYAAQTIAAGQSAATLAQEPTFTVSPQVSLGPTATLSTVATSLPEGTWLSVSIETNCRTGPGTMYDRVGSIQVGEVAQVFGRDAAGQYWYIRNPDNAASYCWIISTYATVNGSTAAIPVMTPPATPTPGPTNTPAGNFTFSFVGVDACVGSFLEFNITNNGTLVWESIRIQATDTTASTTLSNTNDMFEDLNGCVTGTRQNDLAPGEAGKVASSSFGYNISGHNFNVTITLCSQNALGGTCLDRSMSLTAP